MKPIGPLMIEHRLIEKVIALIDSRIRGFEQQKQIDLLFIDVVVDFVRTYADRTHHGKEEDILFRTLAGKEMSAEHSRIMEELVEEHRYGRKLVGELVEAKAKYLKGDEQAFATITDRLKALTSFYPGHITREDRVFFPAAMGYLSQEEQGVMLEECWLFDRQMIHEKYRRVVKELEEQQ